MKALNAEQRYAVGRLVDLSASLQREQIAYKLQEEWRSSDGDLWIESTEGEMADIWESLGESNV